MSGRRTAWGSIALVLVLLAGAAALVLGAPEPAPSPPETAADTTVVPPPTSAPPIGPDGDASDSGELLDVQGAEDVAVPTRVRVPSLGIDSSLDRLVDRGGADGALETPPRWQVAGWFGGGPRPGETGPAVIAGHVDSPTGPAVFTGLDQLEAGDEVIVDGRSAEPVRFRVDRLETAPRDRFPTEAVYGPTPDAQLRLITCDGPYDAAGSGYRDNLIVYATEVAA